MRLIAGLRAQYRFLRRPYSASSEIEARVGELRGMSVTIQIYEWAAIRPLKCYKPAEGTVLDCHFRNKLPDESTIISDI
jgi:hypothetical protein